MIRLDLARAPAWLDLVPGVRIRVAPLSTAVMVAARGDPAVADLPEDASMEVRALVFAKAIARISIMEWEGVGDAEGGPIDPSPEAIDALLELWPIFEAFQTMFVAKGLDLEQEKNGFAPSPNGTSEGAPPTAKPAKARARTARRG